MGKKYNFESFDEAAAAVDRIGEIYDKMAGRVRDRFRRFLGETHRLAGQGRLLSGIAGLGRPGCAGV